MKEVNLYLTAAEEENGVQAAVQACQENGGAVLVYGSTHITNSSLTNQENHEVSTIHVACWSSMTGDKYETYSDSGIEKVLSNSGVMFESNFVPVGTYIVNMPETVSLLTSYFGVRVALSYIATSFNRQGNYTTIISSSSRTNSTSTALDQGGSESVVVHGIEHRLGVDLGVDTDQELHVILKKNGAGALSDMLKEAYGTGTKKKRPRK